MICRMLRVTIAAMFVFAFVSDNAQAGWRKRAAHRKAVVDTPREARMDRNNDGMVSGKEAAVAHRHSYLRKRAEVDRPWEAKADANNDGSVDGVELRAFHTAALDANKDGKITGIERRLYWTRQRVLANSEWEMKFDKDNDGYLSWEEAREMLREKLRIINTNGLAIVNTDIELEFDVNEDGVIDREEAKALKASLDD